MELDLSVTHVQNLFCSLFSVLCSLSPSSRPPPNPTPSLLTSISRPKAVLCLPSCSTTTFADKDLCTGTSFRMVVNYLFCCLMFVTSIVYVQFLLPAVLV
ncbi:hypothetical protein QCA50_005210 [Cerrena zonata]|uniref:Uncharacterized protein n=1 Tax=Cerrena zonata TaxID=2478898 RepID=A0AAW0GGR8_9APHY